MCEKNFKILKNMLYTSLILGYFNFNRVFIFYINKNK